MGCTLEPNELLVEKVSGCGHHVRARIARVELNRLAGQRGDPLWRHRRLIEAEHPADYREVCQFAPCTGVHRIERNRLEQPVSRRAKGFAVPLPHHRVVRAQNEVVSPDFLYALVRSRLSFRNLNNTVSAGDLGDDLTDDLVLNEEDIGHLPIEPVGPNVGAGLGVDELRHDADAVVGAPYAALEHITHPEIVSELGDVDSLALILKGGVAREQAKVTRRPRQLSHEVLGQAVAEILLLRVAAQIDEGSKLN